MYISDGEATAIKAIDGHDLDELIDKALMDRSAGELHRLPLSRCGSHVATKLHHFESALRKYRDAKSSKKMEETRYLAERAGRDLSFAFSSMKVRLAAEERDRQFFRIDDQIHVPWTFSKDLSVRVSFRWRRAVEDPWTFGTITFHHEATPNRRYDLPRPKRKPSPAKQAQELQEELSRTWEQLRTMALYSVRDYFRDGGDGNKIPETFRARPDPHTGGLNNFSADFWRDRS